MADHYEFTTHDAGTNYAQTTTYVATNRLKRFLCIGRKTADTYRMAGQDDTWTYYEDGSTHREFSKDMQGRLTDISKVYYRSGNEAELARYKNGVLGGAWYGFHDHPGLRVKMMGDYAAGKKVGPWVQKDIDGKIETQTYYKDDGSETGYAIVYDDEGKPAEFRAIDQDRYVIIKDDVVTRGICNTSNRDTRHKESINSDQLKIIETRYQAAKDFAAAVLAEKWRTTQIKQQQYDAITATLTVAGVPLDVVMG